MSNGWLPGYERIDILGCTGPGTFVGLPTRWVGHTTESGFGSMNPIIAFFRGRPCSTPHFAIDPSNGRKVQFIPIGWSSAALKNASGGVETNRANTIQTEVIGRAGETHNWDDAKLQQVGEHLADLIRYGADFDIHNWTPTVGAMDGFIARSNAPQRMSHGHWNGFSGACWHQHVPENDHWDGGKINMGRVVEHAQASLAGTGTPLHSTPEQNPEGPRVLTVGMQGEDVYAWQNRLAARGYWIAADSDFGSLTKGITEWFQVASAIDVDGAVGPQTLAAMDRAEQGGWVVSGLGGDGLPTPTPMPDAAPAWPGRYLMVQSPLMTGEDVRTWQQQMANRGWTITVDGVFGEQSRKVALSYQIEKGLAGDGIVGPATWTAAWTAPIT